ncbi:OLC1v1031061C1 [Oldenlandia corymbosa var. corymbosa]|uniref:OLC1v1031061C1 n=1 Tax=Oldenlandia corymbosa var. corymbosa TaxID=529605 RepID=A0AAV1CJC5_OLDCO|nr:OLC1v1031061C1 [Oldenlandia corymbosa var. corymbosa]
MGLCFFKRMIREGVEMDHNSYVFSLKGCGILSWIEIGSSVHCRIRKAGFVNDLIVRNALVHFYSEKGQLDDAKVVFFESSVKDVVSWTSLIDGFVRKNLADEALDLFGEMCSSGIEPNEVTMISLCSACSLKANLALARSVHELVLRKRVTCSLNLMNALLDMYVKCGDLAKAEEIFGKMDAKDVFSWTSMITGDEKHPHITAIWKVLNDICLLSSLEMSSSGQECYQDL